MCVCVCTYMLSCGITLVTITRRLLVTKSRAFKLSNFALPKAIAGICLRTSVPKPANRPPSMSTFVSVAGLI